MNKLNLHTILALTLILFATSCERNELPESMVTNEPVFYLEGNLVSNELFLQAGSDDITVVPAFDLQANNIPKFSANFTNSDHQGLYIDISGQSSFSSDQGIVDYVNTGSLEIQQCEINQPVNSFFMEISESQNVLLLLDTIELPIDDEIIDFTIQPGPFSFAFINLDAFCLSSVFHNLYNSGDLGDFILPEIFIENDEISYNLGSFDGLVIQIIINENVVIAIPPNEFVPISSLLQPGEDIITSFQISYLIDGVASFSAWSFDTPGMYCTPEFDIQPNDSPIELDLELSRACIKYIDENNNVYVSSENSNSTFEILDMEIYNQDPLGREAYKLKIQCDLELVNFNNPSDIIELNLEDAYIPIVIE